MCQFEKLWGDMTALPEVGSGFMVVPSCAGSSSKTPPSSTAGYGMARRRTSRDCAIGASRNQLVLNADSGTDRIQ